MIKSAESAHENVGPGALSALTVSIRLNIVFFLQGLLFICRIVFADFKNMVTFAETLHSQTTLTTDICKTIT